MTDTTRAQREALIERLRTDVLWHQRRGNETIAADCADAAATIRALLAELAEARRDAERAWAARDAAAADLEAHAAAEAERAVAAERERWQNACGAIAGDLRNHDMVRLGAAKCLDAAIDAARAKEKEQGNG